MLCFRGLNLTNVSRCVLSVLRALPCIERVVCVTCPGWVRYAWEYLKKREAAKLDELKDMIEDGRVVRSFA